MVVNYIENCKPTSIFDNPKKYCWCIYGWLISKIDHILYRKNKK